jgi:hypothetical protein
MGLLRSFYSLAMTGRGKFVMTHKGIAFCFSGEIRDTRYEIQKISNGEYFIQRIVTITFIRGVNFNYELHD